jgi:hypothetical protein
VQVWDACWAAWLVGGEVGTVEEIARGLAGLVQFEPGGVRLVALGARRGVNIAYQV